MTMTNPIRSKRVPRFVEEFCRPENGENATRAAIAAGWPESWAHEAGYRLLKDVDVQALIVAQREKVSKQISLEAADVLREWLMLATADPSKIMNLRSLNCRYCWGVDHAYQWGAREYAEALDASLRAKPIQDPPDCSGGFGWRPKAEPCPDCPECGGEGIEDVHFVDTDTLTGPERKLFAGVKRTRDGLEIKLRDQDAALNNIAKYLGLLIDRKELTGKDGRPLLSSAVPADLPSDPVALAALYTQVMGG